MAERSLELFVENFRGEPFAPDDAAGFNERLNAEFDDIRDFIVAHYCLTQRDDTEFWRANKDGLTLPDSLADRLASWAEEFPEELDEVCHRSLFKRENWMYILTGMEFWPSYVPGWATEWDERDIHALIQRRTINRPRMLRYMPDHAQYLDGIHGAGAAD